MQHVTHGQVSHGLFQGPGSLSDRRILAVLLVMTAMFAAAISFPDVVSYALIWVVVIAAVAFAAPSTSAALGLYGLVLSVVGGVISGSADTPLFWVRMAAFGALSVLGIMLSIQRARREAVLIEQATTDELTGLATRRLLVERLAAQLELRQLDQHSAVLYADLDSFKQVNDSLGHAAGDEVLLRASERLRACTRTADTLARFGGDEFVMACPSVDGASGLTAICERITEAFSPPFHVADRDVVVGISIGAALTTTRTSPSPTALIDAADAALIECKQSTRGTFRIVTV